jgi:hypothetical protein
MEDDRFDIGLENRRAGDCNGGFVESMTILRGGDDIRPYVSEANRKG